MEVLSHFYLALDLKYINEKIFNDLKLKIYEISNQLNSLRKSQINK
ncbi:four helix bundle protein [Caldithrix abyssi DSM 13497]|nr:four helix bundle protein [Caldithrix abyssi DSM 13497]